MECGFCLEVLAPKGLIGLEGLIQELDIGLYTYLSGFNNKIILKSKTESIIELNMDSSTTDVMHGSGYIKGDFDFAKSIIKKIGNAFEEAGYNYKIGIDDENSKNTLWLEHKGS